MTQLSFEVVDDFSRLLALRPEWSSLLNTVPDLTPFQTTEWLLPWWQHFGSGTLRCLLFRKESELVGLIPCFLHEWNSARQITLVGAGISDYLEPAIKPEHFADVVAQTREYLTSSSDWDICHWQDLSFDTPFRALASHVTEDTQCMVVPLVGSFDAYWESCGKGLRQNVRRDLRKAESQGKIEFDVTREAAPELLSGLIEMHRERWERKDQSGMIEANRSAEFLRDVAREFAAAGTLRIFSLRFDGKLVAVILGFSYRHRLSNYLTGFDPAYERLGFGRTLLYQAIRHCFENSYTAWDFLRGDEPYKTLWRAQVIPKARVIVTRTA